MQIVRNCCSGGSCRKPSFNGLTERASEKICSSFQAPNALALHMMSKKGAMIDYNPEKDCFYIVGRLNEKGKQYTAPINFEKIRELVNEAKSSISFPFAK